MSGGAHGLTGGILPPKPGTGFALSPGSPPGNCSGGPPMQAFYAALLLTMLPAEPNAPMLRVDWTHAAPANSAIAALRGEYAEAVNLGDVDRASNLYTPDALTVLCDG